LPSHPALNSIQTFQIDHPTDPNQRSFTYPFGTHTGFLEPSIETPLESHTIPYSTLQLFAASHFAQHIRAELFASQGYTTSAGISSTKLLSKLLSDLHKPALQSLQNPYITPSDMQMWLDTFKVEKLNGFGFRTGWILRNKILGEEMPEKGTYGDADKHNGSFSEVPNDDDMVEYSEGLVNGRPHVGGLSVGKVRTSCTAKDFLSWFGTRLGPRLWELLHGIDSAEVISTPIFPKQISVEDSYPDNRTLPVVFQNLGILTKSLVRRLDLDLRVGDAYVRFPRTLRLSMRNGRQLGRESKSARMPVELFDLTLPTERRVDSVGRIVNMLARGMIAGWPSDWRVGVINVAATDLMENMPGKGIQGFIDRPKMDDQVDWDVIRELPEDIRAEVLRQYHLSPDRLKTESPDEELSDPMIVEETEEWENTKRLEVAPDFENKVEESKSDTEWDDDDGEETEDTKEVCEICGVRIFSWMRDAHARYHDSI
jgi:DNA polymerase iota